MVMTPSFDPYALPKKRNPYAMSYGKGGSYGIHSPITEPRPRKRQQRDILLPWDFSGQRSPEYLCLLFHGRRGRGKSTGATAFAKYLYDINHSLDPEYKVYANYKVNFADMCHPRLVDALITFPPWLRKCLIIVDEIAVYFPSVRATASAALNFSTFLQEIRKLEVDMIFTTQFPTMILGNASIQIDMFFEPYLYHKVYEPRVKAWVNDSCILNGVDWWGQWTGYPIHHRWPPEPQDTIVSPRLHMLRNIYHQFDTKEIIPAFWHPSRDNVMERQGWQEFIGEEDEQEAQHKELVVSKSTGEKQYQTLQALLDDQDRTFLLSTIFRQAQKIDPTIKKFADLADAMRRMGWSCYQEGGKTGQWVGERLG